MTSTIVEQDPNFKKLAKVNLDPIEKVRNTILGRLYYQYVKKYAVLRCFVRWAWSLGLYFYMYLSLLDKKKKWRQCYSLSDYTKINGVELYSAVDATVVKAYIPRTFPICEQKYLLPYHGQYQFPAITIVSLKNAMVYGGTNLVLMEDESVLCHDLYNFELDHTSEELHGRIWIDPKAKRIRWLLHDKNPEYIDTAASFLDACALNYAHWLTEVLPRIMLFCEDKRFVDIPIIVNEGLHKNIIESLLMIVNKERKIILCPVGRALFVKKLYIISPTGYVPFQRRKKDAIEHSQGLFSPDAFELLRNKIDLTVKNLEGQPGPEKIILRRNSSVRCLKNASELETLLIKKGYVVVETEKLSFLQQVALFKNAKIIIATTGAALATAIFCAPGTQVIVLMAKHKNMIYRYWCNILAPINVCVTYVLCNLVKKREGMHGDFLVNIDEVLNALAIVEAK